jgi:hypothetical protein
MSSAPSFSSATSTDNVSKPPAQSNVERTPNVYINGLPPNFPEEQLLAMTREFGAVQSVRTFTRHVADRPSGYGFVLYAPCTSAAIDTMLTSIAGTTLSMPLSAALRLCASTATCTRPSLRYTSPSLRLRDHR